MEPALGQHTVNTQDHGGDLLSKFSCVHSAAPRKWNFTLYYTCLEPSRPRYHYPKSKSKRKGRGLKSSPKRPRSNRTTGSLLYWPRIRVGKHDGLEVTTLRVECTHLVSTKVQLEYPSPLRHSGEAKLEVRDLNSTP